jgi:signal peptidase I
MSPISSSSEKSTGSRPLTRSRGGPVRQVVDTLVCLALAVILFRTFQIEGYVISTGSMAPSLLGYHKRVRCPACSRLFAFGVAHDRVSGGSHTKAAGHRLNSRSRVGRQVLSVCPNCGQDSIDVSRVPRNQGDQLLVHKNAYLFQNPRRWEVIVFRNPHRPTQPYVKRIVGLPGETIQIVDGDVAIDGRIEHKSLSSQRAVRIPVHDHSHVPSPGHPGWQPRWIALKSEKPWKPQAVGFVLQNPLSAEAARKQARSWVSYRHWVRSGGFHKTVFLLKQVPPDWQLPDLASVSADETAEGLQLTCVGAMSRNARERLLASSGLPGFQESIRGFYEQSHLAPITDSYGYNRVEGGVRPVSVRDLMFSAELEILRGDGEFVVRMTDRKHIYDFELDVGAGQMILRIDEDQLPARSARLSRDLANKPIRIEMSLFDRQILIAINDRTIFEPWTIPANADEAEPSRQPVSFGGRGLAAHVRALKLYRDVHYTRKGASEPCTLGPDEYYVLGDNSPISFDSRSWPDRAVNRRLFLGKPFVVHLPSRPGKVKIGGRTAYFRIPDFSRIRYIR